MVLAIDTSWKAIGFYLYQQDPEDPKKKYYARFESIMLNEREARFSQPKRELFGLMRALEEMRYWLIGCRKLIVETDASYIFGMLRNPDYAPNATINRWIEKILMFHFTLKHKKGKTFGPDGLSRRDPAPGDPVFVNSEEYEDEPYGPPDIDLGSASEDELHDIKDFADTIDNHGGYMLGCATSHRDIKAECLKHQKEDKMLLGKARRQMQDIYQMNGMRKDTASVFVEMLLPDIEYADKDKMEDTEVYPLNQRTSAGLRADEQIQKVKEWLKNPLVRPEGMSDKEYRHFIRYARQFFLKDDKLYKQAEHSMHKLFVEPENRMYILAATHDSLGHRGFFAYNQTGRLLK